MAALRNKNYLCKIMPTTNSCILFFSATTFDLQKKNADLFAYLSKLFYTIYQSLMTQKQGK